MHLVRMRDTNSDRVHLLWNRLNNLYIFCYVILYISSILTVICEISLKNTYFRLCVFIQHHVMYLSITVFSHGRNIALSFSWADKMVLVVYWIYQIGIFGAFIVKTFVRLLSNIVQYVDINIFFKSRSWKMCLWQIICAKHWFSRPRFRYLRYRLMIIQAI